MDAAEVINQFFATVGDKLNEKLPQLNEEYYIPAVLDPMSEMKEIDVQSVEMQIDKIDTGKSSGLQAINARMFKLALLNQKSRFCKLLNLCTHKMIFPRSWKIGTVVPLPKKGDLRQVTNLRPVTLLPVPGKIFE